MPAFSFFAANRLALTCGYKEGRACRITDDGGRWGDEGIGCDCGGLALVWQYHDTSFI
jgi:hypothetical protein